MSNETEPTQQEQPLKLEVSADALRQVLQALNGPAHFIRELQFTRTLPGTTNPINTLVDEYNAWANKKREEMGLPPQDPEAPPAQEQAGSENQPDAAAPSSTPAA